ncbi:uncharacterized protein LOC113507717 isoform X2 [Trichoplusia ni]|uniref:Uncharacterized protein LOC113507717 isoform X2 n=1 Tax=Trichoplusia ni TaxID=7111 RepID=A0A7E5X1W1_TRINI|nr:uncharacterized protein LOC113507717 isoform X2 [Trichoplusia ni]
MLFLCLNVIFLRQILFAFDSCDCKCDEYIIVLKETACIGRKDFDTVKLTDVKLNELTYYYNSTRLYDDTISFKECILEVECDCSNTNTCLERETEQTETEDKTEYDLNIINVNTKNNSDHINNNIARDNMFMVYCDYAEDFCDADVGNENYTKYTDVSKNATLNETVKDLQITLKRDEGSVIQPIFTGFSSKQSKTGSSNKTFLDVNLICKYKQNIHCESERKAKNTSEEKLTQPNKTINVYLKSDYIKNNTKIKYTGCRKQSEHETHDDQSKRKDEFAIESETPLDRIGLILLVTIAAVGLLLAVTLRKCARKGRYSPAPVREPQDLEDTAF